ncbi:hypothetical protein, partial [Murinocardiopsis flavida]|uniref:hypothetical protein n=1 Tax=Murinocardiopsis flavida TaxID=645275 RepID=UPI001B802506
GGQTIVKANPDRHGPGGPSLSIKGIPPPHTPKGPGGRGQNKLWLKENRTRAVEFSRNNPHTRIQNPEASSVGTVLRFVCIFYVNSRFLIRQTGDIQNQTAENPNSYEQKNREEDYQPKSNASVDEVFVGIVRAGFEGREGRSPPRSAFVTIRAALGRVKLDPGSGPLPERRSVSAFGAGRHVPEFT